MNIDARTYVIFRDGTSVKKFKKEEQVEMKAWGDKNKITVVPIMIIKHGIVRILDSQHNYYKLCKVKLDEENTLYSTADRFGRGSKPFLAYYSGDLNIEPFIVDTCSLHYSFKNLKEPIPLFKADRTVSLSLIHI